MKCLAALIAAGALAAYGYSPWLGRAVAQDARPADTATDAYARAISAAVADFEAGRFTQALAGFQQAHALQPSARTWRGLGLASYSPQDFAQARRAFERALIDPRRPLAEAQRAEVESLLRETAQRTGRFELHVSPDDARVEVDGAATSERELVLSVGAHSLSVSAPNHVAEHRTLQVRGAEVSALSMTLAPVVAVEAPPSSPAPSAAEVAQHASVEPSTLSTPRPPATQNAPAARDTSERNVVPWIVLGAAPVFAIASGVVWWTGLAERDAAERECARDGVCTRAEADQRERAAHLGAYETWTNVLLGASLLTAATGVTLWLWSGTSTTESETLSLGVQPTGVRLHGQF